MTDDRQEKIDATRAMLEFLEVNPEVPLPYELRWGEPWVIYLHGDAAEMASLIRIIGGKWKRQASGDNFNMVRKFPAGFVLRLNADRGRVCKRVKVSTKVIPAHTIPAQPETHVPERAEEIYDWECPDSILKGDDHDSDNLDGTPAQADVAAADAR